MQNESIQETQANLPSLLQPLSPESVQQYAEACIAQLGLNGWTFGWDRAVRRLGCCHYRDKRITLSRHFVARFLLDDPQLIRRTVLHELAHALAFSKVRETGPGRYWRYFCTYLGIGGEKSRCNCADFAPQSRSSRPFRYALCHCETGEVFYRYKSRPRLTPARLKHAYITGRKKETIGRLCIVQLPESE